MAQPDLRQTVTIPLTFPVTVDGMEHKSLVIRRPKTRDTMAAARQGSLEIERTVFMLARLCDVATDVIEDLDQADTDRLVDQFVAFRGV